MKQRSKEESTKARLTKVTNDRKKLNEYLHNAMQELKYVEGKLEVPQTNASSLLSSLSPFDNQSVSSSTDNCNYKPE